jgi:hypothetical protein
MFNNFFPENRAVHEVMWKNMVEPDNIARARCLRDS